MWKVIADYFSKYPSQAKVAKVLLANGMNVHRKKIYSGKVAISDSSLARAAGVDRRVVHSTIATISSDKQLLRFFSNLLPTANLRNVASTMGWSAVEIISDDAHQAGILAAIADIFADAGISIRQAIVDDPETSELPKIFIITESTVPPKLLPQIKAAKGVKSLTIY